MFRSVLQPVSLSDGTFLPAGTTVVTPSTATHYDDENYENAAVFEPFRFLQEGDNEKHTQQQLVTTSAEYVPFGHGKHAR